MKFSLPSYWLSRFIWSSFSSYRNSSLLFWFIFSSWCPSCRYNFWSHICLWLFEPSWFFWFIFSLNIHDIDIEFLFRVSDIFDFLFSFFKSRVSAIPSSSNSNPVVVFFLYDEYPVFLDYSVFSLHILNIMI